MKIIRPKSTVMKKITLLCCMILFIVSCEKDLNITPQQEILQPDLVCEGCGIDITKDNSRLTLYNTFVNLTPTGKTGKNSLISKNSSISLELNATLDPIYIDINGQNVLLNANQVAVKNKRIAASYSLIGEPYSGAVDVLSVDRSGNVNLDGTLVLPDRDIDAIDFISTTNLIFGGGFDARVYYGSRYFCKQYRQTRE